MSTVVSRIVRSSPYRDTAQTWTLIADILTQGNVGPARRELLSIAGIASSVITEQGPKNSPIVVTCSGPRTRVYCLYDEDAIDASDAKEDALGYDPLNGDWRVSLPCPADDLPWVQRALKAKSTRVTARDMTAALGECESSAAKEQDFTVDQEAFHRS